MTKAFVHLRVHSEYSRAGIFQTHGTDDAGDVFIGHRRRLADGVAIQEDAAQGGDADADHGIASL